MILHFFEWLFPCSNTSGSVLCTTTTRMIYAAFTSWLFVMLLAPTVIQKLYELKIGQAIRKEHVPVLRDLHAKKENTPTMGGVMIIGSLCLSSFLWMRLNHFFTVVLLTASLYYALIGGLDDYLKVKKRHSRGLIAKGKFWLQNGFAIVLSWVLLDGSVVCWLESHTGLIFPAAHLSQEGGPTLLLSLSEYSQTLEIPFFKKTLLFSGGITGFLCLIGFVFIITGSSNAFNLTDGLDGLATGCTIVTLFPMMVAALISHHAYFALNHQVLHIEGSGEIAVFLAALLGSCFGFLWFNAQPAQVFMGDTGSLALGGIMGICAILLKKELFFGIVSLVFVVETLSVMIQVASFRLRKGKRVFLCAPLHHHFEYKGWPESKVVVRFWIAAFLCAVLGLLSIKL